MRTGANRDKLPLTCRSLERGCKHFAKLAMFLKQG